LDQILLRAESGNVPTRTILPSTKQYSPLSFEPDGRPSFGVEANPIDVRDASEIERAVRAFARSPNGCLIVTASPLAVVHRELIVTRATRHRLPAVYFDRMSSTPAGLSPMGLVQPIHAGKRPAMSIASSRARTRRTKRRRAAGRLGLGATRGLANGRTLNLIFVSWPRRARGAQSFA
jgi:hypothetical protein